MKTSMLLRTILFGTMLITSINAQETQTLPTCAEIYDTCSIECESLENAYSECIMQCDAKYEACSESENDERIDSD